MSLRLKAALGAAAIAVAAALAPALPAGWLRPQDAADRSIGRVIAATAELTPALAEALRAGDRRRARRVLEQAPVDGRRAQLTLIGADDAVLARNGADARPAATAPIQLTLPLRDETRVLGRIELRFDRAALATDGRSTAYTVVLLALAAVALSVALGHRFGATLATQLAALRREAARAGRGEFDGVIPVRGGGELAETARCFNQLLSDLTRQSREAAQQRRELERLALVAEKIEEGVLILDKNRVIEWANESCTRLTGYGRDDLIGRQAPGVFKRENIDAQSLETIIATLKQGKPVRSDALYYRKDGQSLWVDLCLTPVMDEAGELYRFVAVQRDVTERRRLMDELDAHRNHLEELVEERTGQLAEKTRQLETALAAEKSLNKLQRDFVSMVSHEFRTPLAIIDGAVQRMNRRGDAATAEDRAKWTDKIRSSVARMTQLIESTISASRMDAGEISIEPVDCDLAAILEACRQRQQDLSPEHDIRLEIESRPTPIVADPVALEQICTNLLSNAVKYSPDRPEILVRAWCEDGQAVLEVIDRGLGMDEEDLEKLFERFFRAKTSTGIVGTGIGLNLIKMLIERHGGEIAVTSLVDEGSTFTVRLPIDARPFSAAAQNRLERSAA